MTASHNKARLPEKVQSKLASAGSVLRLVSHKRLVVTASVALLLCVTLGGCSGFFINPSISSIFITPSALTLAVGDHQQLTCTARYSDGSSNTISGENVGWTSSDTTVATVTSPGGEVTGVANGNATVTCSSQGVTSSNCSISVTISNINSISISTTQNDASGSVSTASIAGTQKMLQFYAYANGTSNDDVTTSVTWMSTNPGVASIGTHTGVAISLALGTTNIFATITDPTTGALRTSQTIVLTVTQ